MKWLVENWYIVVAIVAVLGVAGLAVYKFLGLPTKEQLTKIKQWLVYATAEAEKQLGSKTGQLKLRFVYDMFIAKFPVTAKLISFDKFSALVDEALDVLDNMLKTNTAIAEVVTGESAATETTV